MTKLREKRPQKRKFAAAPKLTLAAIFVKQRLFFFGGYCALERKRTEMDNGEKRKVYLESTIFGYLTGRPSVIPKTAYWQALTRQWWDCQDE